MNFGKKSWEGKRVGDPVGRDIRLKEILLENRAAFGFHSKTPPFQSIGIQDT